MPPFTGGKLYRYYSFSGDYKEYVRQVIVDSALYYNSPSNFNDPFDCKLHGLQFTDESLIKFFVERHSARIPRDYLEPHLRDNLDNLRSQSTGAIADLQRLVDEQIKVMCFTKSNNNILMFSHYADKHKGICLEFDIPANDRVLKPEQVIYATEYPQLTFSEDPAEIFKLAVALVSTKAELWSYEMEYRSILGSTSGYLAYPPEYLTGVIFGCQSDETTRLEVRDMVALSSKKVNFYKAEPSQSSFSLNIEGLT